MRRTVEVDVPAHVAYERICRTDEYPLYRTGVREVTALSETAHRWELDADRMTARVLTTTVTERRPDELLRWRSVEGPTCGETVVVKPLSPRRSRVTIDASGPPSLLAGLVADLNEFKRRIEHDHPGTGHHVNERPATPCRHRSNWRDDRFRGPTTTGTDE
jgi:uncharacterized membrane protein